MFGDKNKREALQAQESIEKIYDKEIILMNIILK